ncbi:PREDICTED: NAC domain-containing protein 78-like [Nicotiana attenuata]|uniref:Nac domain-containing protein 78 n=1 Tax=Nicotiana attenuata TaxID=49451 RepID=A0A314KH30_NICAT|nr:PREDICTED: NAC domain-containing protein 78-like [Nicotiana attenuata]OIT28562.1 nac domain-containing protein 78 [Nicotiana attenuata]
MSMVSRLPSDRFYPTDAELIYFLKKFLKGESLPSECPIRLGEIYGDRPPWEISDHPEEKIAYFISPLKKRKESHKRFRRTCANGTWKAQTGGDPIKNSKGTVVGFRKSYVYRTRSSKGSKQDKINWLMREYYVGDDYFWENNIPKQDIVLCRIKKNITERNRKNGVNMEEQEVAQVIEAMLREPDQTMKAEYAEQQDNYLRGLNKNSQILTTYDRGEATLENHGANTNRVYVMTEEANTAASRQEEAYGQLSFPGIHEQYCAEADLNTDNSDFSDLNADNSNFLELTLMNGIEDIVPDDWWYQFY